MMKPKNYQLVSMQGWCDNNYELCQAAEKCQRNAEISVGDAINAGEHAEESAQRGRHYANRRFNERIQDLEFLQGELEKQKEDSVQELDILLVYKKRTEEALNACSEPLTITKKCVEHRNARIEIELVHDPVVRSLQREENAIIQAQVQLKQILANTGEQIRLLKATQYALDMDLRGKEQALGIDRNCAHLNQNSPELSLDLKLTKAKSTTPSEWDFHTRQNISASNYEIKQSRKLRSDINLLLRKVHEEITKHYQQTNNSFNKRIRETKDIKQKLENELSETTRQANIVRTTLTKLEEPMTSTAHHAALACTRLSRRATRPGVENCRDAVELQLNAELTELHYNAEIMRQRQAQAESSLQYLRRSMEQLTEDLNKKINTLMIDEVQCMTLRLSMHYHLY